MSFFSGLEAEGYDRQYTDRELLGRLLVHFRKHSALLIAVMALILVIAGMGVLEPVIVGRGVDRAAANDTLVVTVLPLAVLIVGLGWWLGNWARRSLTIRIIGDVIRDLQRAAFEAAIRQDLSFFDRFPSTIIFFKIDPFDNVKPQL